MNQNRKIILKAYKQPQFWLDFLPDDYSQEWVTSEVCADRLQIGLQTDAHMKIQKLGYSGSACIISIAAAEILCQKIYLQPLVQAKLIVTNFIQFLSSDSGFEEAFLGDLIAFANLKIQSNRLECGLNPALAVQKLLERFYE